jgi:phage host-nuclease inhibitor protein Gam
MGELEDDMQAWLAGDGPYGQPGDDPDAPKDADGANRLLRARARREAELADIALLADAEHARIAEWVADRAAGPTREVEAIDRALEGWARATHDASGGRVKTWKLPNGTLKLTAARESLIVDDLDAFVAWADDGGGAHLYVEKVTRTPDAAALKAMPGRLDLSPEEAEGTDPAVTARHLVDHSGEVIPGVHVEAATKPKFNPPK